MRTWLYGVSLLWIVTTASVKAEQYLFAVVPQQSATRLAKQWTPILQQLSKEVGHQFLFTTATDIPTFEKRVNEGAYDLAYMNPYHFVVFNDKPGYQAVAKAKDKKIRGIIVVRKDSGIESVNQLNGQELAFPSPAAFAASILTRAYLAQRGVHFTPKYVSSHDSVYLGVERGFYKAGGGIQRTFNAIDPNISDQLTPIWTTQGYTPHAIAAHPNFPPTLKAKIDDFFAHLADSPEGRMLIEPLKIKGFVKANNSDWDDVRALNIHLLD
ncbi:phosphate ABC transporter substrate-binding protein [Vibrio sp. MACH09]|uniref:PhnD/SsuA/transferrin family substrate-binding protein n=1 Tax=Vibrio sp. MACH09 TaxID=3025122 RepID=UPI002792E4F8|nr:PhnD/SsuA/transferrin family substrate-binding protein [Vibrio sp. MACH09]GLO63442.1 phosphate ABC transporter substrate-binding protein [Vibrio sp. MACH09]